MKLTKESLLNLIREEMDKVNVSQEVDVPTVDTTTDSTVDTISTPTVDSSELIADVDAIMTSLETLSSELKEQLETPRISLEEWLKLNDEDKLLREFQEADIAAMTLVGATGALAMRQTYRYLVVAPAARKAQRKVNKMNLQLVTLKVLSKAPMPDSLNVTGKDPVERKKAEIAKEKWKAKQETLKQKFEDSKKNAEEMQQLVDDKYEKSGDLVKKALTSEKMKGRKQMWETEAGLLKDNPKAAAKLKKQAAAINARIQAEEKAAEETAPSKDEQKKQVEMAKKEVEADANLKKEAEAEEDRLKKKAREEAAADAEAEARAKERGELLGAQDAEDEIKGVDTTTVSGADDSKKDDKKEDKNLGPAQKKLKEVDDAIAELKNKKNKSAKDKASLSALEGSRKSLKKKADKEVQDAKEKGDNDNSAKEAQEKKVRQAREEYDKTPAEPKEGKIGANIKYKKAQIGLQTVKKAEGDKDAQGIIDGLNDDIKKLQGDIDTTSDEQKPVKNSKEDMLKRLETLLDKEQAKGDDANDAKVKKIQDMISKVGAKESWQIDGTQLGSLLEREIKALENMDSLNESKYQNLSIKDRFSKLL